MKFATSAICIVLLSCLYTKTTKHQRSQPLSERQLTDSATGMLEKQDKLALDKANNNMSRLVSAVVRLKNKLYRELETSVTYLHAHFNQRDAFDKRVMMQTLAKHGVGTAVGGERRLSDQAMLKDYGKIDEQEKNEAFEVVKVPLQTEAVAEVSTQAVNVAEVGTAIKTAAIPIA